MNLQTRREFLKAVGIGATALALPEIHCSRDRKMRPNIIYILADDLGYGELGCYGQKLIRTPNLDRMAGEGLRFTDHYAGSTVCAPSRCSLLTGNHTGHTWIRGNREFYPEGQEPLPVGTTTLATLLQEVGYATGLIGKWGLGGLGSTGVPNRQGFDYFFGYLCQREAHNHYPQHLWRNHERVELGGQQYRSDLFAREALDFIRRNRTRPFFLYLAFTIPHFALQVPEIAPYADADWPPEMQRFAAMITRMDAHIGALMALLKELGIDRHTLVMFSSDNGPHQEGGARPDFFNSSGGLRGIKRDLYEGGIRVPLIARWLGTVPAGEVTRQVSAGWDILPTFCEAAGRAAPAGIDGLSLMPTLRGHPEQQLHHEYLYWEFHERGGSQAIRMGEWKAVRLEVSRNPVAPVELYDLKSDPHESQDVAEAHPEVTARMRELFRSARMDSELFTLYQSAR